MRAVEYNPEKRRQKKAKRKTYFVSLLITPFHTSHVMGSDVGFRSDRKLHVLDKISNNICSIKLLTTIRATSIHKEESSGR